MASSRAVAVRQLPFRVGSQGIRRSLNDNRQYRYLQLPNRLQVMLVHDPLLEESCAAMTVGIGHGSDPATFPGMAHFLEHMLFLGSRKFPEESGYKQYLSQHGGRSNASTYFDRTTYWFAVQHEYLQEALDRFAQFFVAPLLSPDAVLREIKAVDNEFSRNFSEDGRRMYQLLKHLCNEDHAFHKFGSGNMQTLLTNPQGQGLDTSAAMHQFYADHYSSNLMSLAIVGPTPPEQLEEWVQSMFSGVPDRNVQRPEFGPQPLSRSAGTRVVAPTLQDTNQLQLFWALPPQKWFGNYDSPGTYLTHTLAYGGPGSLLSDLKQRELARGLQASSAVFNGFTLFSCHVQLTEEGKKDPDGVAARVCQYLNSMRARGPQDSFFKQLQYQQDISLRFQEAASAAAIAPGLSADLQRMPWMDVLTAPYLLERFQPTEIQAIMDALQPDNMVQMVLSKSEVTDPTDTEPFYKVPFRQLKQDAGALQVLKQEQQPTPPLPASNPFQPADFSIVTTGPAVEAPLPNVLVNETSHRVWYLPDRQFEVPYVNFASMIATPNASGSARTYVLSSLHTKVVTDLLQEVLYQGDEFQLSGSVSQLHGGYVLAFSGFHDTLPQFVRHVCEKITLRSTTSTHLESVFSRQRERIVKKLQNFSQEQPVTHAEHFLHRLTRAPLWTPKECLQIAEGITVTDLMDHVNHVLSFGAVESLVYGNATAEQAMSLSNGVASLWQMQSRLSADKHDRPQSELQGWIPKQQLLPVEKSATGMHVLHAPVLNKHNQNSAIVVEYRLGPVEPGTISRAHVLGRLISQPFFSTLRTKEQLGYIVSAQIEEQCDQWMLQLRIQSNSHDGRQMLERIQTFLASFHQQLQEMPETTIRTHADIMIAQLTRPPTNQVEQWRPLWMPIHKQHFQFDRRQRIVEALKTLSKRDVEQFFDDTIHSGGVARTATACWVNKADHPQPAGNPKLEFELLTS